MMRLADRPQLMPAQTLFGSTTGPVVDTGVILINGGRVYLSRIEVWSAAALMPDVVEGIAGELGWVSPELGAVLKAELEALKAELELSRSETTRVVTLDDARELLAGGAGAGTVEPAAA